ncbi:aldo/keto reductase [Phytohabitans rumicis]|uniref:Aldo/keto reductase n=1 Tax=Phytohabitans rumicis TaxID=1076125 RepID=A0A6V8LIF6_9ACTN|nr:aldo/keto reductase [Phytohabitans rumicis]GFJ94691.1 aldo/keto reductase [Phytohabitans rumicis]
MNTVTLGNTGERVSQLALGAMLMGTLTDEESSFEILDRYAGAGGNFIDTANCYAWWTRPGDQGGESEELLGRWFARTGKRDDVFLATKGSAWVHDPDEVRGKSWDLIARNFEGAGGDTLRRAIDDSLRRLGTDHVDLYYVHVDDRSTPLEETLGALGDIVKAGKARYIGWSNVRTWRLERIRQLADRYGLPAPVALQQQHSYLRRRAGLQHASIVDDEQMDFLRANPELTLVAYSPILKGVYDDPEKRRGHGIMEPYEGPDAEARIAVLTEVAAEVGVTPNQLVIAWLLHQDDPTMVTLIGPRTVEQYAAALPALDVKLSAEQLRRLAEAGA